MGKSGTHWQYKRFCSVLLIHLEWGQFEYQQRKTKVVYLLSVRVHMGQRTHTYSAYLHISNNANSSRSNRCCVYERGVYIKGQPKRELSFTGANQFNVDDYEVFEFF